MFFGWQCLFQKIVKGHKSSIHRVLDFRDSSLRVPRRDKFCKFACSGFSIYGIIGFVTQAISVKNISNYDESIENVFYWSKIITEEAYPEEESLMQFIPQWHWMTLKMKLQAIKIQWFLHFGARNDLLIWGFLQGLGMAFSSNSQHDTYESFDCSAASSDIFSLSGEVLTQSS